MHRTLRLPDDIQAKIKKLAKEHCRSENGEVVYALSLYIQRCEDDEASEHENDLGPEEIAAECAVLHPGLTHEEYEKSKKK
jgi:predicted transcriptional regulator